MEEKQQTFPQFVQENVLEIMDYVHTVCTKEDIKYSLYYGTMLGAARHKGFIPWDGDVDIVLLRHDFERFCSALHKYPHEKFELAGSRFWLKRIAFKTNPLFEGKKISSRLHVDLFILDKLPETERERKRLLFKIKKYQGMLSVTRICDKKHPLKQKVLLLGTRILGWFHNKNKLRQKADKLCQSYREAKTDRLFISNSVYTEEVFKENMFDGIEETDFEGRKYKIFSRYDELLRMHYGDYMQLPSEEERIFSYKTI